MPERFAVIGHPISHSLSPQLYQFFMNEAHIDGKCFRATGYHLSKVLNMMHDLDIHHFNVTHPFKQSMRDHLSSVSPEASQIGAVNTVIEGPQNRLSGFNTDHSGIRLSVLSRFRSLKGVRALIVGAGGAARAAAFALCEAGAEVSLTNRNHERGLSVAKDFSVSFHPLNSIESVLSSVDVLVWTIPGYPPAVRLPLGTNQLVLDANYKEIPEKHYFGNAERMDGLNWLIHQGWQSFCVFSERKTEINAFSLKRALTFLQQNRNSTVPRHIALVGFMGAGKRTIGKKLAERIGWNFLDTDAMCEEAAGKTISAIFRDDGENAFRCLERQQVEKTLKSKDTVIALGGGALMTPGILQMLSRNTFTIWLYQPQKVIEKRCSESFHRPLFTPGAIKNLMTERTPSYLSACDLIVESEGSSEAETTGFLASEFSFLS